MKALKELWQRQDGVNRAILVSGIALALYCLAKGKGLYGVVVVILMGLFCVAHLGSRTKRLSRTYGSLFFHAPDGEIVPMTFEQVSAEYLQGQGLRYMERPVTVRFPYWRRNARGELETGFGLCIRLDDFPDPEGVLPTLKSGQFISVTGQLLPHSKQYFDMGRVEALRRISEKEIRMV